MRLRHARFLFSELQRPLHFNGPRDNELRDFDVRLRLILRKHLVALGWWSIASSVAGLVALGSFSGVWYYFCMMSGVWGLINFAITIALFNHTFYHKFKRSNSFQRLLAQSHVERMMALNIGIDAAYVFVGCWLREHSFACQVPVPELWIGFGWAIVVQGGFLILQDSIVLRLHRRNFCKAKPYIENTLTINQLLI